MSENNTVQNSMTFKEDIKPWLAGCLATFEGEFGPGEIVVELTSALEIVAVVQSKSE